MGACPCMKHTAPAGFCTASGVRQRPHNLVFGIHRTYLFRSAPGAWGVASDIEAKILPVADTKPISFLQDVNEARHLKKQG